MSTELLVPLLVLFSSVSSNSQQVINPLYVPEAHAQEVTIQPQQVVNELVKPIVKSKPKSTIKPSVRETEGGKTTPQLLGELPLVMRKIAHCESGSRQFEVNGKVLRGRITPGDVGIFQINTKVHLKTAQNLGFDVFTKAGNISYAMYLYKLNGTRDWSASRTCWA